MFSNPNVSTDVSFPSLDCPPNRRRPGGGRGSNEDPAKCWLTCNFQEYMFLGSLYVDVFYIYVKLPMLGGAEMVRLQDAIPPFSLIEDSIHGKKANTLV